jgi:chromate transporter
MLIDLFFSFLQIGLFSIGGGYVAIPLIQQQVVTRHGWLSMAVFNDLVTIAEMTPGPIGINAATFVGVRTAGLPGAVIASLDFVLPSLVIVSLLGWLYYRYRKAQLMQRILNALTERFSFRLPLSLLFQV